MAPLRLLCFHGYRQNERTFRERAGALRKVLRGRAELVGFSAPLRVPEAGLQFQAGESSSQPDDPRGWWFSNPQEDTFNALEVSDSCKGLEESMEAVAKVFVEQGPFSGILGFSQGAALVAMLCALKQRGDQRFPFDFAILVAGFKSRSTEHQDFYKEPIDVPTLHVFGETDRVIPGEMSQELLSHFIEPSILTHQGGHFLPASSQQKKVYLEFLDRFSK
ncbi:esterase OVCA2 [Ambystoma mexicanum]|uniref:esterase OVCA2 n=1 Tax=Ambystoma mexicanum TaxID=8296 RepID=UPI0037E77556